MCIVLPLIHYVVYSDTSLSEGLPIEIAYKTSTLMAIISEFVRG